MAQINCTCKHIECFGMKYSFRYVLDFHFILLSELNKREFQLNKEQNSATILYCYCYSKWVIGIDVMRFTVVVGWVSVGLADIILTGGWGFVNWSGQGLASSSAVFRWTLDKQISWFDTFFLLPVIWNCTLHSWGSNNVFPFCLQHWDDFDGVRHLMPRGICTKTEDKWSIKTKVFSSTFET